MITPVDSGSRAGLGRRPPSVALTKSPPLPPNASLGKRWRFRRNLVIYVAHRNGLSQRLLAEVFDLPCSRISTIIHEFQKYQDHRTDNPLD
jgi:hypothetical protein